VLSQEHAVLDVRRQLPLVDGMRFGDVDEDDVRPLPEAPIEPFDVAGPATKRWSGEAAEDEQERPVASQVAERDGRPVVEPSGCEIGQQVADGETVGAAVPDERRDDDLAFVGAQLLDVGAVARIEGRQAWVVRRRH
jgi:hypothetical protein